MLFVDRGCPELGTAPGRDASERLCSVLASARAGKAAMLESKSISNIERSAGSLNTHY